MKNLSILLSLVILLTWSCRKSVDETIIEEDNYVPEILEGYEPREELVTASVFGTIVNEEGISVEGANIELGNQQIMTGTDGAFLFKNVEMNKSGTFIKITKEGYFDTGRRFYPDEASFHNLRIELIPVIYGSNFESGTGATIDIQNAGGFIVFGPNTIANENGDLYNGIVEVATTWLAPNDITILNRMPGALEGVNLSNEEVGLQTFGMIGVELRGSSGEKLNLLEGATAEIHVDIPASMESTAPSEIPLWSFNDFYGIWVEESSATLVDGHYVGKVSHFSFWNCDDPIELVYMDLSIVNGLNGQPVEGVQVNFTTTSSVIATGSGYSNAQGKVEGFIPKDQDLVLEILSPCGEVLVTQNIGPYSMDISLGQFEINNMVEVSGEIIGCEGADVNEGILIVKIEGEDYHYYLQNNPFNITIPTCLNSTDIEVAGGDLSTLTQGEFITAPVDDNINLGTLAACGEELLGYWKVTVDQVTTRYFQINSVSQTPDTLTPFVTYIFMSDQPAELPGDTLQASIGFASGGSGYANYAADWSDTDFIDYLIDTENGWYIFGDFESFIIDEYGPYTGTLISGYMSGNLTNTYNGQNTSVFVEASFSAIRDD